MSKTFEQVWDEVVLGSLEEAKAIAWDECHKIYILLDDNQVSLMREYGYDPIITSDEQSAHEMLETVKTWYSDSCGLRFVEAVATDEANPNAGFESLIPQGYEAEFCLECGEFGTDYDGVCDECREDEDEDEDEEDED